MLDRILLESDVIKAVDRYTENNRLNTDITCILEEIKEASCGTLSKIINVNRSIQKQKRVQLFENDDIILEQRGNRYFLSLYDKEGNFQREVTVDVKDDYKVGLCNGK